MKNNYGSTYYYSCTNTSTGIFSPATWDFRPVKGLEADGNGKTSYITEKLPLPEGIEMKDFNGNPIDLTKETCDIGAVQGAVKAAGAVILPVGTIVDGKAVPLYKTTYARTEEWPRALVIKPTIERFFSFEASGDCCGGPESRFLQLDGTYHMIPPPFSNQTITLENKIYKHEYWCSPNADASVATGAEDKPFRTVQDAIVAATNAMVSVSGPAVVNLLPGEYREGGAFGGDHNNRIVIPSGKSFLIQKIRLCMGRLMTRQKQVMNAMPSVVQRQCGAYVYLVIQLSLCKALPLPTDIPIMLHRLLMPYQIAAEDCIYTALTRFLTALSGGVRLSEAA